MNLKRLIKQGVAIGGTGIAAIQLFGMMSDGHPTPEALMFFFLSAVIGGIGAFSLIQDEKEENALKELGKTQRILRLITESHGKTTFADLIMKMEVPIPELKAKLDELQKEGILGMEISNSGEILYTVSNPIALEDKLKTH